MPKCEQCNKEFDVDEARSQFDDEFEGDPTYDESYEGKVCGNCAVSETSSNMNAGRAIDMMNGEEDYDDAFVEKHL